MIEDTIHDLLEGIAGTDRKIYGVVVGVVVDVLDPLMLGRVKVRVPAIDPLDDIGWARVSTPMTGFLSGHYMLPTLADEVLVAFESGDVKAPVVIGSLWNATHPPPFPTPLIGERVIRTPEGSQLGFRMVPPAVTLTTPDMTPAATGFPPGITIASNEMITLMCGPTQIILTPAGLTITAPSVIINSSGPITETASSVSTMASGAATVAAFGSISISAPMVTIN
jgi:phage baseplate assembly protein gpV